MCILEKYCKDKFPTKCFSPSTLIDIRPIWRNTNVLGHNIVLYCIMRPCTDGRLDRYRIGIPRELSEIRTQPWLSEGSLTCDPCHHRGPIF